MPSCWKISASVSNKTIGVITQKDERKLITLLSTFSGLCLGLDIDSMPERIQSCQFAAQSC
jgi:hypothetical protein